MPKSGKPILTLQAGPSFLNTNVQSVSTRSLCTVTFTISLTMLTLGCALNMLGTPPVVIAALSPEAEATRVKTSSGATARQADSIFASSGRSTSPVSARRTIVDCHDHCEVVLIRNTNNLAG